VLAVNKCGVDRWAVGITLKPLGRLVALAAAAEGAEQKGGKVGALGLLKPSSSVQTFAPGRFARLGREGRQMSACIKPTHPFVVSS